MARILIVSGSPSPEAPTGVLLERVADSLRKSRQEVHVLGVRVLPTVALLSGDLLDPTIRHAMELVERAAGVVVASPVYRAGYSGRGRWLLTLRGRSGLG